MSRSVTPSPLHPLTSSSVLCPLCNEAIDIDKPLHRVAPEWSDVVFRREQWAAVAESFRTLQSIEAAAVALTITPELTEQILQFLCLEICGCRRATCPACLDDYRSAL